MIRGLRGALTVPPFRGDVVAAGAVALTTAALLAVARTDATWAAGARLALVLPVLVLVGALAVLAPPDGPVPRAYHVALHLATVALVALAGREVARGLGADRLDQPPTLAGLALAPAVVAAWFAARRDSAPCTLVAAAGATGVVVALVAWAIDPADLAPLRWPLLLAVAVLALATVGRRDRAPRHAAAFADAGALAALGIAFASLDAHAGGAGWELLLFAAGFGVLAYGAVDAERVAAVLGGAVLAGAVLVAAREEGALRWWPAVLAVGGLALLAVGLRPTTPAPPPPDDERPAAPTVTLRELHRE